MGETGFRGGTKGSFLATLWLRCLLYIKKELSGTQLDGCLSLELRSLRLEIKIGESMNKAGI